MKFINYEGYLTEGKLGEVLRTVYLEGDGYKVHPQWKLGKYRVDYLVTLNGSPLYAYEFDGPRHFTSWVTQRRDTLKEGMLEELEIKLIRIPYFIQLRGIMANLLLHGDDIVSSVTYPHGFIDSSVVYPSDFNSTGFSIFHDILGDLPSLIATQIVSSSLNNGFDLWLWPLERPDTVRIDVGIIECDKPERVSDSLESQGESLIVLHGRKFNEFTEDDLGLLMHHPGIEDHTITKLSIDEASGASNELTDDEDLFTITLRTKCITRETLDTYCKGIGLNGDSPMPGVINHAWFKD
jgi:very-short-patch-repair endonuclease